MATRYTIRELENSFVPKLLNCKTKSGSKRIHAQMVKLSLSQSNFLVTKMVDFCDYSGNLDYASLLFKQVVEPNVFLFNAMIRAYTHYHVYGSAIALYKQMLRYPVSGNLNFPDKFTFPFVIKCCAGLYCEYLGRQIHGQVWKFGPESHLNNIKQMPMKPDSKIWGSLLSSCRTYSNLDIALIAIEQLQELEPDNAANYVLLSTIYADLGRWKDVSRMRRLIRSKSMKKAPGCSSAV